MTLADEIRRAAAAAVVRLAPRQRLGVVVSASPLTVTLGGDVAAVSATTAGSYRPAAGDTVAVLVSPGAVPLVLGTTDTAGWSDLIEYKLPSGSTDTGSSTSYTTWLTLGNITVPAGVTSARYRVDVSGVYCVTASQGLVVRLTVGGVAAVNERGMTAYFVATTQPRFDYNWAGRITGLSAGARSVVIQTKVGVSTGALRADTSSLITAEFGWEP